mmetsp:Transcript_13294/g.41687  ORF Transcript_13294/g.41687 Transcript_13294/m.41687 type:complete len:206 (-) Transcript_13294:1033-1650(-)
MLAIGRTRHCCRRRRHLVHERRAHVPRLSCRVQRGTSGGLDQREVCHMQKIPAIWIGLPSHRSDTEFNAVDIVAVKAPHALKLYPIADFERVRANHSDQCIRRGLRDVGHLEDVTILVVVRAAVWRVRCYTNDERLDFQVHSVRCAERGVGVQTDLQLTAAMREVTARFAMKLRGAEATTGLVQADAIMLVDPCIRASLRALTRA